MINKEYGSDFHYLYEANEDKSQLFVGDEFSFFFSGRVALFNLLKFGIEKYKWEKIGFPSYYCHEVVEFCKILPIEIIYYEFNPLSASNSIEWDDEERSVFVNVDYFGIKKLDITFLKKSIIIDDLTHNLLSLTDSNADYCFASLRKQIPLAVGGFCLSKKKDFKSQIGEIDFANKIAVQKLSAMYLKYLYLEGLFQDKRIFRELYKKAEKEFESIETNSKLPDIIYSQLVSLNTEVLIQKTRKNCHLLKKNLKVTKNVKIIQTFTKTDMCLVLQCETVRIRDQIRDFLIDNSIYPSVLWPKQILQADIELENTILCIHCDFRYNESDIDYITKTINKILDYV